ncbi:Holliday junction resolvase RuvX [Agromyces intestinalis]|uniref:Putative pre-16S rRNA nuclease n=1 Tax=Agromyces intestinalis TaxID=2592652 RepID=A0A5C1YL44_9MICO|nr:Holliday junction resolvase RuvX [Agromyces intestinalis]QEO15869.1 Holliday junction resolvase RuvX [Agromyces intestinalis]
MRHGVRLGIDVGRARIGVARSDAGAILAVPVETVARVADGAVQAGADVQRILEIADEHDAFELVVGNPLSLSGQSTASTHDAVAFAGRLAAASDLPVRLVDERLSTVSAQRDLRAAGRPAKRQRSVVDQAAAVIILQHAIDAERASGDAPGRLVPADEGPPPT